MEPKFHNIDPNGDTLLILRNPNAPFLVPASSTGPQPKRPKLESADGEQEVRMRLSSKHLVLASTYFMKSMDDFKETSAESQYFYTINAKDFDEQALLLLMNILHGKTETLPSLVSLEKLAKLSLLAATYECQGAVRFFYNTWLQNLEDDGEDGSNPLYALCTSWVFADAEGFLQSTIVFIQKSKEPLDHVGLPIPQRFIDALNGKREAHISAFLASLHKLVKDDYSKKEVACTFECASMCLGALIKKLGQIGLFDPYPLPPYAGHSMSSLDDIMCEIGQLSFDNICPYSKKRRYGYCQALSNLKAVVREQLANVKGLKMIEPTNPKVKAISSAVKPQLPCQNELCPPDKDEAKALNVQK